MIIISFFFIRIFFFFFWYKMPNGYLKLLFFAVFSEQKCIHSAIRKMQSTFKNMTPLKNCVPNAIAYPSGVRRNGTYYRLSFFFHDEIS